MCKTPTATKIPFKINGNHGGSRGSKGGHYCATSGGHTGNRKSHTRGDSGLKSAKYLHVPDSASRRAQESQ